MPGRLRAADIVLAPIGSTDSDSNSTYPQQDRFREEAIMSIAHRISTAGLGGDRNAPPHTEGNLRGRGYAEPESVTSDTAGSITSHPWEGLYQRADETTPSDREDGLQPEPR